jgi:hypothetical protein
MIVRKTVVAGLFLALAGFFFIGAGEASAQYRPAGGNNRFNQTYQQTYQTPYQSPFNRTPPPPVYTWRNGDGLTRTSNSPYYNPNHFLPTWNPTPNQVYRLQRR